MICSAENLRLTEWTLNIIYSILCFLLSEKIDTMMFCTENWSFSQQLDKDWKQGEMASIWLSNKSCFWAPLNLTSCLTSQNQQFVVSWCGTISWPGAATSYVLVITVRLQEDFFSPRINKVISQNVKVSFQIAFLVTVPFYVMLIQFFYFLFNHHPHVLWYASYDNNEIPW